ncbi:unnamed protein product [Cutaneotrichosporon oleaginosum]
MVVDSTEMAEGGVHRASGEVVAACLGWRALTPQPGSQAPAGYDAWASCAREKGYFDDCILSIASFIMGRSAKFMKRPTQKERETRKRVKAATKPLSPPKEEPVEDKEANVKAKKRKMMRAKADKVGDARMRDGFFKNEMWNERRLGLRVLDGQQEAFS